MYKKCIIFSYLSPRKFKINGDNNPLVLIYLPVIMPFYKSGHVYTANSTSRGYMNAESFCNSYVCYRCL